MIGVKDYIGDAPAAPDAGVSRLGVPDKTLAAFEPTIVTKVPRIIMLTNFHVYLHTLQYLFHYVLL